MSDQSELFQSWYESYAPSVRNYLFRLAGAAVLDDLVQETFLRVWMGMAKYQGRSQVKTWIIRIAHNVAMDRFRKAGLDLEESDGTIEDRQGPESRTATPELKDLIQQGLLSLSETLRPVFILHYHVGFQIHEIAEVFEIPEGTVKTRLFAARNKFIAYLHENGVDHDL